MAAGGVFMVHTKTSIKSPAGFAAVFSRVLYALFLGWAAAAAVAFLLSPTRNLSGLDCIQSIRLGLFLCVLLAVFILAYLENISWLLPVCVSILSFLALGWNFSLPLLAGCALLIAGSILWCIFGRNQNPINMQLSPAAKIPALYIWLTAGAAIVFFVFVSGWGLSRIFSFSTPTYDFGLFAQMFSYLKSQGIPYTTLERDGLLSHFSVHVSPIYYLLLPFYCLVPRAEMLPVLQAAVLVSSLFPLWKLGKLHRLNGKELFLFSCIFLLYPAFSGGTGYDIHENCFLTPLLLWLFWGLDAKKYPAALLAAVLTLGIKEDAAMYVAVIGLWQLLRSALSFRKGCGKALFVGIALFSGSILYFLAVTRYLSASGDGVMTYRYGKYLYDGSGSLLAVIKAVFLCPMKAVYECLQPEKLRFLLLTLLPLLGLPLCTRRFENLLLLIPYILMNLMPDYRYQHDIFFQYTFGSYACLAYLALVHVSDFSGKKLRLWVILLALAVSLGCFSATVVPKANRYFSKALENQAFDSGLRSTLEEIPQNASVTAHTFYTTALSSREILYDLGYCSREHLLSSEYIAISPNYASDFEAYGSLEEFYALLEQNGYFLWKSYGSALEIFQKLP